MREARAVIGQMLLTMLPVNHMERIVSSIKAVLTVQ